MIHFIRKRLHTYVYKIIIFMTFVSMVLFVGMGRLFNKSGGPGGWALRVNGWEISPSVFKRRLAAHEEQIKMMQYQLQQMGMGTVPQVDPTESAVKSLVDDTLLDGFVSPFGFSFTDAYIKTRLADRYYMMQELSDFFPAYMVLSQPVITSQMVAQQLRSKGVTTQDFEVFVERSMARNVMRNMCAGAGYVPSFVVKNRFVHDYCAKQYTVLVFSFDRFLAEEKKRLVIDAEVTAFYNTYKERYRVPAKRSGRVWEFSAASYGVAIDAEKLQAYYDENKMSFVLSKPKIQVRKIVLAERNQAEQVRQELLRDASGFEQKAKQFSLDKKSAARGGLVDFFERSEKETPFQKAAFGLKEDGAISDVVKTDDGFVILQRVARKKATYKTFDQAQPEIAAAVRKNQFKMRFADDIEMLMNDKKRLAAFVESKQGVLKNIQLVAYDGSALHKKLFGLKEAGDIGYYRDQDKGYLVELGSIQRSVIAPLAGIHDRVVNDVYEDHARRALCKQVEQAMHEAQTHWNEVEKKYGVRVRSIDWLKNDDAKRIESLNKEGLPVVDMLAMEYPGQIISDCQSDGYLVRLEKVQAVDAKVFEEKRRRLAGELNKKYADVASSGFIASLHRNATIEDNVKAGELDRAEEQE